MYKIKCDHRSFQKTNISKNSLHLRNQDAVDFNCTIKIKTILLILAVLALSACAKPQLEEVQQSTLKCTGPNYGFTATTNKELQAVEGYYYDKTQNNYFLVGMRPFVAFNVQGHEVVVDRTGLYIDNEYAGDVTCEQY